MASVDEISSLIDQLAPSVGVPADYFKTLVFKGENPGKTQIPADLVSPGGATGIAQVMPEVFRQLVAQGKLPSNADINDPATNLKAGLLVAKEGIDRYGQGAASTAHYNAGWKAGDAVAAGKPAPSAETRNYLVRTGMATSSSTTDRVSSKTFDTDPAASVSEFLSKTADSTKKLSDLLSGASANTSEAGSAAASAGSAAGAAVLTGGDIDVARNQQFLQNAGTFGADTTQKDNIIVASTAARTEAQQAMDKLRPVIDAEDQVAWWDDPLRYLVNIFTLPKLKIAYNSAKNTENEMTSRIALAQREATQQDAIQPAQIGDILKEKAAQEAAAKVFSGIETAQQLQSQSQTILAQNVMHQMSADSNAADFNLRLARLTADTNMVQTRAGESNPAKAASDNFIAGINLKLQAAGVAPVDSIEAVKLLSRPKQEMLQEIAGMRGFGRDIGQSYQFLDTFGALPTLSTVNKPVYDMLVNQITSPEYKAAKDTLNSGSNADKFARLDTSTQRAEILSKLQNDQVKEVAGGIGANNELKDSNPYKLRIGDALLNPALADNPIAKDLVTMQTANMGIKLTDKDVLLTALGRAKALIKDDPKAAGMVASEVEDFYRKATANQHLRSGMGDLGYPAFEGYGITNVLNSGAPGQGVQTFSPATIQQWIVKNMRSDSGFNINMFDNRIMP